MGIPLVTMFYLYDRSIYVDEEKTADDPWGVIRPKKGLPTDIAKMYSIMGLLWGDYTYLIDRTDLSISLTHLVVVYWFSML